VSVTAQLRIGRPSDWQPRLFIVSSGQVVSFGHDLVGKRSLDWFAASLDFSLDAHPGSVLGWYGILHCAL
jgi:hypothetical protein